jgi:hypothetical protein
MLDLQARAIEAGHEIEIPDQIGAQVDSSE